ncbi:IS110 family transposase [Microvirga sp. VF16]|uniref:IS110 family transposase n=1 Tax=Microvirga sp. VF16 TaxID=2807101 RepID=UPI00193D5A9A|nr:IS110 family transposase [Microvirga sp. VF16]QRM33779.1 IS110 family transposase [Microvirga sp. VF16]
MAVATVGLDLAKHVFQVHCADAQGRPLIRKRLRRAQVQAFFEALPPCLVGREACASAHHWARELSKLGHRVRLVPPQYVRPFVKTNKNDTADAEAICEAIQRPTMRFVPAKSMDQQAVLTLHRSRDLLGRQRTMLVNALRGHCAEFGLIGGKGCEGVRALIDLVRIGSATQFKSGRQLAAWLGLVPRQFSTGGKPKLGGISKRGDGYLRRLLIHGARSVLIRHSTGEARSAWVAGLTSRRSTNIATVAIANKNARIAWAVLTRSVSYEPAKASLAG